MNKWFKSGTPWIWLTGSAVSISLIAVIGIFLLLGWKGLSHFWPNSVYEFSVVDQDVKQYTVIGEIYDQEIVSKQRLIASGINDLDNSKTEFTRFLIKIGNRELVDLDFVWVLETTISESVPAQDLAVFERTNNGNFYGYIESIQEHNKTKNFSSEQFTNELQKRIKRVADLKEKEKLIVKKSLSKLNIALEDNRLNKRKLELDGLLSEQLKLDLQVERQSLHAKYLKFEQQIDDYRSQAQRDSVIVRDMTGAKVTLPLSNLLAVYFPNDMGLNDKITHWFNGVIDFVMDEPREANTEGGVFPAIFGTVLMVILMAIIVTPFGVLAAIYLHEYAKDNFLTKFIRISVINLAGVPSIVYGVFGLGFFVYIIGGSIDQLLYEEALPAATFGSPGVLWAALTLAILTLPVVIVSTEEGLSRIPGSLREASLALGATKSETLWRVIIPMASPAIMTGLILAIARAAGEVAPLMLVGVVKMAPALPVDDIFPYLHLERKFMHLGYHIYDVGFQSPNVEATRPLVYATSFLLVTVIIGLNLAAIALRNNLREKYKSFEH
ncbi:MAG: phosphate ABC transporter permease PstA [Psychromonas sp.]